MKNRIKVVFVIVGALIGAGFASGKEIDMFFYAYGWNGILGLILCCILMSIVIGKVLNLVQRSGIATYEEFLYALMKKKSKNKYLTIPGITNLVVNLFLVITFFIMIAGFGAYFSQELGFSPILGSSILAILSFCIFMGNVKGLVKANEILVPLLILFIFLIGILNWNGISFSTVEERVIQQNFLISSLLYCSYNSILLIPVLITLKEYLKKPKDAMIISGITGGIVTLLGMILFFLLTRVDVSIETLEMPAVYVIRQFFYELRTVYGFIILASIFTTSISLGTSFLNNVTKNKKSYTQIAVIMCITSIFVSNFGFSNLVNLLYPIFGYLGLVQIFMLLRVKAIEKKVKN